MTVLTKLANVFHHVAKMFMKKTGTWKQVRGVYVKKSGVWKQTYGRPAMAIFALGLEQTLQPAANKGVWINGVHAFSTGRSWGLVTFDKYGNMTAGSSYDLFGEAQDPPTATGQLDGLTNALNAMPTGQLFALITFDEPMALHTSGSLPAAVYRVGGTAALFAGSGFNYRGAYMLLGKVGSAPYTEQYNGVSYTAPDGTVGDPNAAIAVPCTIFENNWYGS